MNYTRIHVEIDNGVGHIRLDQPDEYNRMPPAFWEEFPRAVRALDQSGEVRVLIVSSTGKHFSAGMDTSVFTAERKRPTDPGRAGEAARRHLERLQQAFTALEEARMPILAAVQGGCIGAGLDLVSACDMRYCTREAFFCIQEINIGMAADVGTLQRLPRLIPDGMMRELAYTGRRLGGDEAREIGLVNAVFDTQDELLAHVRQLAAQIASKSPLAIHSSKHIMNYGRDHSIEDTLQYQQVWMGALTQGPEMAHYFGQKAEGKEAKFEDLPPLDADRA